MSAESRIPAGNRAQLEQFRWQHRAGLVTLRFTDVAGSETALPEGRRLPSTRQRTPAFTPIELLVVIAIIAILMWEPTEKIVNGLTFSKDGSSYPENPERGGDGGPSRRHKTGSIVLSVDGHGEFPKFTTFDQETRVGPSRVWWAPDTANGH